MEAMHKFSVNFMKGNKGMNETIINGSRVFIENGEVKTVLSKDIEERGYMSVDESYQITLEAVNKIYELNAQNCN